MHLVVDVHLVETDLRSAEVMLLLWIVHPVQLVQQPVSPWLETC